MNIFFLDKDPILAAKSLSDTHISRMGNELTLLIAARFPPERVPWGRTNVIWSRRYGHHHNPLSKWIGSSLSAFAWARDHTIEIAKEYILRFEKTTTEYLPVLHLCTDIMHELKLPGTQLPVPYSAVPEYVHKKFPIDTDLPVDEQIELVIKRYRFYYIMSKMYLNRWRKTTDCPDWWFPTIAEYVPKNYWPLGDYQFRLAGGIENRHTSVEGLAVEEIRTSHVQGYTWIKLESEDWWEAPDSTLLRIHDTKIDPEVVCKIKRKYKKYRGMYIEIPVGEENANVDGSASNYV